jgi:hypothetical protein
MNFNLQELATTELKLTADQLSKLLEEAVLKEMPDYTKAKVSFNVGTAYGRGDEIIGHEFKGVSISLSKQPLK